MDDVERRAFIDTFGTDLEVRRKLQETGMRAVDYYIDTGLCVFCEADDCQDTPHDEDCDVGHLVAKRPVDAERKRKKAQQRNIVAKILTTGALITAADQAVQDGSIVVEETGGTNMGDGGKEPVDLGHGKAIRSTNLALCVKLDTGEETWIPKSVIHDDSEVYEDGGEGTVVVHQWWAEKNGLA
jgi:hypothetical protein